jgi:hypothetical protein
MVETYQFLSPKEAKAVPTINSKEIILIDYLLKDQIITLMLLNQNDQRKTEITKKNVVF